MFRLFALKTHRHRPVGFGAQPHQLVRDTGATGHSSSADTIYLALTNLEVSDIGEAVDHAVKSTASVQQAD